MSEDQMYLVVRNHEDQYSIWPAGREVPRGWKSIGQPDSKKKCLEYIEQEWTDMRPASLQRWLADESKPLST